VDWATLAHDTVHRQAVVNMVMEFWVPKKCKVSDWGIKKDCCPCSFPDLSDEAKEVFVLQNHFQAK